MLYFVRIFGEDEIFYKVGVTIDPIEKRFHPAHLMHYQYELLALYKVQSAAAVYEWEQAILETFAHLHYRPQGKFIGASECFSSANEILSIFPL